MSQEQADREMLALAALTKSDLRDVDQNSMGGNLHADKIDIRKLAGVEPKTGGNPQQGGQRYNPNNQSYPPNNQPRPVGGTPKTPNMLSGFDFIDMPKSRPLGQVDMDGQELPDMPEIPQNQPIEFAPIPESIRENVQHQVENLDQNPYLPETVANKAVPIPTPDMDFDLFQYTMLQDMVKNLDVSIQAMEGAMIILKDKRSMIVSAMKGDKDEC
jgi:hypothetical protein